MENHNHSQLLVIGAGPGGSAAAFRAADLGLKVTLIDQSPRLGGICLREGCIPSKTLLHAARIIRESKEAQDYGVTFSDPKIDLSRLRTRKDSVIARLETGLKQLAHRRNIDLIQGQASFTGPRQIIIEKIDGSKKQLSFEKAVIATGSSPRNLQTPLSSDRLMNSTSALNIRDIPERLLVIGGGYIGLEMGTIYSALGSKVTIVEMTESLLPGSDQDVLQVLNKKLREIFENIFLRTKVVDFKETDKGLIVRFQGLDIREQLFDRVIVATGREVRTETLGLAHASIACDEKGKIQIDSSYQTSACEIYALGDVVKGPMLAHKASFEGKAVAESIAGRRFDPSGKTIPNVIFTDPEVAWCGLTEKEADLKGFTVDVGRYPWMACGRAVTLNRCEGFTKIICDRTSKKILGACIVGVNAGELIGEAVCAIEQGLTAHDLTTVIHPHPTLSETLSECSEMILGSSLSIYRPKI